MSAKALDLAAGDTWENEGAHALFEQLRARGEVLASESFDGGWGHHSLTAVVRMDGLYYTVYASGCSCDGSASVWGPYYTREEAGHPDLAVGDNEAS